MFQAIMKKFFGRGTGGDAHDLPYQLPDVEAAGSRVTSAQLRASSFSMKHAQQDEFYDPEEGVQQSASSASGWDAVRQLRPPHKMGHPQGGPPLPALNNNVRDIKLEPGTRQRRLSWMGSTATPSAMPTPVNAPALPIVQPSAVPQPAPTDEPAAAPAQPEARSTASSTDGQDASLTGFVHYKPVGANPPAGPVPLYQPSRVGPTNLYTSQSNHVARKALGGLASNRRAMVPTVQRSGAHVQPTAQGAADGAQVYGATARVQQPALDPFKAYVAPPITAGLFTPTTSSSGQPEQPHSTSSQDAGEPTLPAAPSTTTPSTAPNSADGSKAAGTQPAGDAVQPAGQPDALPHHQPGNMFTPLPQPPPLQAVSPVSAAHAVPPPPLPLPPVVDVLDQGQMYRYLGQGGAVGQVKPLAVGRPPVPPARHVVAQTRNRMGHASKPICPVVAPQGGYANPGPSPREEAHVQPLASYSNAFWEGTQLYRRSSGSGGGSSDGGWGGVQLPAAPPAPAYAPAPPVPPLQPLAAAAPSDAGSVGSAASNAPSRTVSALGLAGMVDAPPGGPRISISGSYEFQPGMLHRASSGSEGGSQPADTPTAGAPATGVSDAADAGGDAANSGTPQVPPPAQPLPPPPPLSASSAGEEPPPSTAASSDAPHSVEQRPPAPPFMSPRVRVMPPSGLHRHPPPMISYRELALIQEIGEGGFGKVYHAKWRDMQVAVKVANRKEGHSAGCDKEFEREVSTMSSIPPHTNILRLLAICTEPPYLALVTEYCSQGSLYNLLHNQHTPAWSMQQLLGLWLEIARGMEHLHTCDPPVMHRDLKSANVLLDASGCVKICDFGLSKRSSNVNAMTGGLGTYQWMAPEVLAHQRYSHKADVYSFGIVIWECLTRELPFSKLQAIQAAVCVVQRGLRPDMPSGLPKELADLIKACWAPVADQRPEFTDVAAALSSMLNTWPANVLATTPWKPPVEAKPAVRAGLPPAPATRPSGRKITDGGSEQHTSAGNSCSAQSSITPAIPTSGNTSVGSQATSSTPAASAAPTVTSAGSDACHMQTPAARAVCDVPACQGLATSTPRGKQSNLQGLAIAEASRVVELPAQSCPPGTGQQQTPAGTAAKPGVQPELPFAVPEVQQTKFRPEAAGRLTERSGAVFSKKPAASFQGRQSWHGGEPALSATPAAAPPADAFMLGNLPQFGVLPVSGSPANKASGVVIINRAAAGGGWSRASGDVDASIKQQLQVPSQAGQPINQSQAALPNA